MKTGYRVYDVMTVNPVSINMNKTVLDCCKLMSKENVGGVVVLDDSGFLKGIISDTDIIKKVIAEGKDSKIKVNEVMSNDMATITGDVDIFDAIKKMRDLDVTHLPVVDSDSKLHGLITRKDILKIEPQLFEVIVEMIELKEYDRKINSISDQDNETSQCDMCGRYSDELYEVDGILLCNDCRKDKSKF